MIRKRGLASVFGLAAMLIAGPAYACVDPAIFLETAAIVGFQLLLLLVIFAARKNTISDRIKFGAFYLLSVLALWIVNEVVHGWLKEERLVFDYVRLTVGSILLVALYRYMIKNLEAE